MATTTNTAPPCVLDLSVMPDGYTILISKRGDGVLQMALVNPRGETVLEGGPTMVGTAIEVR